MAFLDSFPWFTQWLLAHGIRVFATLILGVFAYQALHVLLDRSMKIGDKADPGRMATLHAALVIALRGACALVVLALTLPEFGFSIAPFVASLGIVGLGLSFGSQTLVRDLVSGLFLLAEDGCRVGEEIEIKGTRGKVEGFHLRTLMMRKSGGELVIIPYGEINQLVNYSRTSATHPER